MQELLETIQRVRERIKQHRADLQRNEALTRYALIDPILRALGWDTEDPEQVKPEFPTETGTPDYALIWEGRPQIMVEAKPLGKNLEEARRKGFEYCWRNKHRYYVVTDGNAWEVWDLKEIGGEQLVVLQLLEDNPGEVARKLLAIWRPAVDKIKPASPPVVQPSSYGITLRILKNKTKYGDKPPSTLIFSDRSIKVKSWRHLLIAIAEQVVPHIPADKLPVRLESRFLLNFKPVHSNNQPFKSPYQVGRLWLETHFSAPNIVHHACRLLEIAGISPDEVYVEF